MPNSSLIDSMKPTVGSSSDDDMSTFASPSEASMSEV